MSGQTQANAGAAETNPASASFVVKGATIIDGAARGSIERGAIWIENGRIKAVEQLEQARQWPTLQSIDAEGKFVIPGLMNANVHLLCDIRLEVLARFWGSYEDLIIEAAQIALKNGVTTVFDTWGPRRFLVGARNRIATGQALGARIYCAGNIIGFDGPFSDDFVAKTREVASTAFADEINAIWTEGVGRALMWLTPDEVGRAVRAYLANEVDFVKFASNEHFGSSAGAFLAFSPASQAAIVAAAREVGMSAQAHTMSVEGLRLALEAGCDLIQHANITGPTPIPPETLEALAQGGCGAVVFPFTAAGFEWIMTNTSAANRLMWSASDANARALIRSGAQLLLATDGGVFAPDVASDPLWRQSWIRMPEAENLASLATGHFVWLKAMEEKGCAPREMLKAATYNIAKSYGKDQDLGTLEPGKIADMLVLARNPLENADNYRAIEIVIKHGQIIDRAGLPQHPRLTLPWRTMRDGEAHVPTPPPPHAGGGLPFCPACMRHGSS